MGSGLINKQCHTKHFLKRMRVDIIFIIFGNKKKLYRKFQDYVTFKDKIIM